MAVVVVLGVVALMLVGWWCLGGVSGGGRMMGRGLGGGGLGRSPSDFFCFFSSFVRSCKLWRR